MVPEPMVIACDLTAIPAAERCYYAALVSKVRSAVRDRSELEDGYTFRLDGNSISLTETAAWFNFERLCCPFLLLRLETGAGVPDWQVTARGPAGIKAILAAGLLAE